MRAQPSSRPMLGLLEREREKERESKQKLRSKKLSSREKLSQACLMRKEWSEKHVGETEKSPCTIPTARHVGERRKNRREIANMQMSRNCNKPKSPVARAA